MSIHHNWKERLVCSLGLLTSLLCFSTAQGSSAPVGLRCEYLVNPQGIDATQPRLFWQLQPASPAVRGRRQTAYQVLVATNETDLRHDKGVLWDSGKVTSGESVQISYSGESLTSQEACWWKVRVWDENDRVSAWSQPAFWTTGLLQPDDWKGQWIGFDEPTGGQPGNVPSAVADESSARRLAARWLRKEFPVSRAVRRATVYFSGLGLSELYLNGQKVGEDVLSPGLTDYDKRVLYVTHDVTGLVRPGRNAVGVILGNGRFYAPRLRIPTRTRSFGYPKLLLQLEVEYTDGTRDVIVSDSSWELTTAGPIRANNEYDGEEYDARREMPGWANAGFDDSAWSPAQIVSAPGGKLAAQMIQPIRVTGTLKPVALAEPSPGVFIFDLGQNMVGWCRLKVRGPAGARVVLRHAETLKPDGTLYLDNIRGAKVTDIYTLNGKGPEVYEPRFTYHGFRYVEVTGFPGKPTLAALEGRVVNDDLAGAGEFSCSQPMINHIYRNILWGVRGNYRSIVTDCPQRDERQGWLGDRSAESKGESYLFDIAALYGKWTQDMADSQRPNGSICDVCPSLLANVQ